MSELTVQLVTKCSPEEAERVLAGVPSSVVRLSDCQNQPAGCQFALRCRGDMVGIVSTDTIAALSEQVPDELSPEYGEEGIAEVRTELNTYACNVRFVFFTPMKRTQGALVGGYLRDAAIALDAKIVDLEAGVFRSPEGVSVGEFYSMVSGRTTLRSCTISTLLGPLGCAAIVALLPLFFVAHQVTRLCTRQRRCRKTTARPGEDRS